MWVTLIAQKNRNHTYGSNCSDVGAVFIMLDTILSSIVHCENAWLLF